MKEEVRVWIEEYNIFERTYKNCEGFLNECELSYPEDFYSRIEDFDKKFLHSKWRNIEFKETSDYVENFQYADITLDVYYKDEIFGSYRCLYKVDNGEDLDDYFELID